MASLIVVMGVSGSGKTTLARALAEHYRIPYLDADDFHSDDAKAHMASGQPLTDAMRRPWIERIAAHLRERARRHETVVLAFSGLKRHHRDPLRDCGLTPRFLFLEGDALTITRRMSAREGHFMPPSLLDSQFESLEPPDPQQENDVTALNLTAPFDVILDRAVARIDREGLIVP